MEISLWKTCLWTQQVLLNTFSYKHCKFEFRHFFVTFGHDGAMPQINNVGKNWAFRFGHSIAKRPEVGNLKVLPGTFSRFQTTT